MQMYKTCRKWNWNNRMRALKLHFPCSFCSLVVHWSFFVSSSESHGRMICWKILNPRYIWWNIKHVKCRFDDAPVCVLFWGWLAVALLIDMSAEQWTMTEEQWRKHLRERKCEAWLNRAKENRTVTHRNFGWRTDERRGRVWSTTVDASTVAFLLFSNSPGMRGKTGESEKLRGKGRRKKRKFEDRSDQCGVCKTNLIRRWMRTGQRGIVVPTWYKTV